jgi:hypothetical protein
MKVIFYFCCCCLSLFLPSCSSKPDVKELRKYAATETYPRDTFLDTVTIKRAVIILAHDDDDCAMAGTLVRLKKEGWEIEQWSFGQNKLAEGRTEHPSTIICKGSRSILPGEKYRDRSKEDTAVPPYMPIDKSRFHEVFATEKVKAFLIEKINAFQPVVIFTLDNEMGAYGNPDHIFVSQVVVDLFNENKIQTRRIYQAVYPNSMEKEIIEIRLTEILKRHGYDNTYMIAKKVYGISGMPEPDVEINITATANEKMEYLRAYHEDAKKNFRKFMPYFDEFDAPTYFSIFDREFFRIIQKQ